MEVELAEVRDFLAAHPPFDSLPGEVLDDLPSRCTLRYARRGSLVLRAGLTNDRLFVVRSGAVDITETFDAGVESLRAHSAYIDGLGWADFDPAEFLEGMSRSTGSRMGVPHAVAFEVFRMGWGD